MGSTEPSYTFNAIICPVRCVVQKTITYKTSGCLKLQLKLYRQTQSPPCTVRKTQGTIFGDQKKQGRNHVSNAHSVRRRGAGGLAEACAVVCAWFEYRAWRINYGNGLTGGRQRWAGAGLQGRSGAEIVTLFVLPILQLLKQEK